MTFHIIFHSSVNINLVLLFIHLYIVFSGITTGAAANKEIDMKTDVNEEDEVSEAVSGGHGFKSRVGFELRVHSRSICLSKSYFNQKINCQCISISESRCIFTS